MEYNTDYFLDTANGYTVTLIENGNRSYNKPTFRSKMAANEYALKLFNEKNTTRYFVERSMNDGLYHFRGIMRTVRMRFVLRQHALMTGITVLFL